MVSTTAYGSDSHLLAEIERLSPWHYALEMAPDIVTPIRENAWINRHAQRVRYFWEPLLRKQPEIFRGARVLDLGCNAGFWTLKALEAGAREVVAIDARPLHIAQASLLLKAKAIEPVRYRLIQKNLFDLDFEELGRFDVILLLGLLYHVVKPFELLERISAANDQLLIIDTKVSRLEFPAMEIIREELDDPRMAADWPLVAVPSASAIHEMTRVLGYDCETLEPKFDDWEGSPDYRDGDRLAFWCWRRPARSDATTTNVSNHEHQNVPSINPPSSLSMEYPKSLSREVARRATPWGPPHFFTICARNYLAFAGALAESIANQYPEATLTVWLLDLDDLEKAPSGISIRSVQEAVSQKLWVDLQLRYSILELSTALKPAVFLHMFLEGASRVIYLDPDIYLFSSLDEVDDLLVEENSGVILPHLLSPLPKDGHNPDDLAILKSGVFNLGFLALCQGEKTTAFLHWWNSWLETHCWADPSTGVFTDQKWLDFVPCLWPSINVLRHPSYDVAYWNLHERSLDKKDDRWVIDTDPLRFFHFSGFNPHEAQKLSKHENRFGNVERNSSIGELLEFYAQRLLAFDYNYYSSLTIPITRFSNGDRCDAVCQRCFTMATERGLVFAEPLATGPGTFHAWMLEHELGSQHPHYIHALMQLRPDIQTAYPDFENSQAGAVRRWILENGQRQLGLDTGILVAMGLTPKSASMIAKRPSQVNYVGYLRAEMGVGEAARGYVRAMQSVGVTAALMDISHLTVHRTQDTSIVTSPPESMPPAPHAINLVHVNADALPMTMSYLGDNFRTGRFTIGLWAWESSIFPEHWMDRFDLVDEIWVGSRFMADAISLHAPCPVLVMPHVVNPPRLDADRKSFGLSQDEFIFLFSFDFSSISVRKNPDGLIKAFRNAFSPNEPVRLLLKSISGDMHPDALARLHSLIGNARITILDRTLDRLDQIRLLQSCDSFVSLHRLEGFGLAIAEAMALGKPVIATAYGGNTDFMNVGNSFLIPYDLVELSEAHGPYPKGSLWAEPNLDEAVKAMHTVVNNKDLCERLGRRAQAEIVQYCGPTRVGEMISKRLDYISTHLPPISRSHTAEGSHVRKRRRLALALVSDLLRSPKHYWANYGKAITYWRRMGTRALTQRVVEEVRKRGR